MQNICFSTLIFLPVRAHEPLLVHENANQHLPATCHPIVEPARKGLQGMCVDRNLKKHLWTTPVWKARK